MREPARLVSRFITCVALALPSGCGREAPPAAADAAAPAATAKAGEAATATPAPPARVPCVASQPGQDPIGPGLPLMWDGSLHCVDAPEAGVGEGVITLHGAGVELEVTGVRIVKATPRPLMKLTEARGAEAAPIRVVASGLPLRVRPGPPTALPLEVHYRLTGDERGFANANLHLALDARVAAGPDAGMRVEIPVIVHVRGKGAAEDEGGEPMRGGRPDKPGDPPGD